MNSELWHLLQNTTSAGRSFNDVAEDLVVWNEECGVCASVGVRIHPTRPSGTGVQLQTHTDRETLPGVNSNNGGLFRHIFPMETKNNDINRV